MSTELDGKRIEQLSVEILKVIQADYLRGPLSPNRVFEALNALAFCAAQVIRGCEDPEGNPLEFFSKALNQNLQDQ